MFIPPWLNPPDPVATYQRGVQIGAQIGEQQANQRLRAQQLEQEANNQAVAAAIEQQKMAQTDAYRQAQLGLEASETARRVQGQLKYQQLIQGGMDPMQAMMQTPEVWGSSLTGVASAMKESERLKRLENWQPHEMTTPEGTRLAEVRPGSWQLIKSPLSQDIRDVTTKDIPGTDSVLVQNPNGTFQIVKKHEEGDKVAKTAEIAVLKSQYLSAISRLRTDPTNEDTKNEIDDLAERLQELGIKVPGLKSAPSSVASPATKYPGVRSVKRL